MLLALGLTLTSNLLPPLKLLLINDIAEHAQLFVHGHVSNDVLNIALAHLLKDLSWHLVLNFSLFLRSHFLLLFLIKHIYDFIDLFYDILNLSILTLDRLIFLHCFEFLFVFAMVVRNTVLIFRHWWMFK